MRQQKLFKNQSTSYGGELLKTRKGRSSGRPLDSRRSMHLVLRSTQAKGLWSFTRAINARKIESLLSKFSRRYGIKILSKANVGNHLHLHIKLPTRFAYTPFIRALTGSIAMVVTGRNRWNPGSAKLRFWDHRPFTRVVFGWRSLLALKSYVRVNQLEGLGFSRDVAVAMNVEPAKIKSQTTVCAAVPLSAPPTVPLHGLTLT